MLSLKIALLSLATNVIAAPQLAPTPIGPIASFRSPFVPIVGQHYDLNPDQSYNFGYQSADGSTREEVGVPRVPGPEGPAIAVQGSFSYETPEGHVEQSYVADENGYQPSGNTVHPSIVKAVAAQVAQARASGPYYPGAFNPGAYNPGAYNPSVYNPAAFNPAVPFRRF